MIIIVVKMVLVAAVVIITVLMLLILGEDFVHTWHAVSSLGRFQPVSLPRSAGLAAGRRTLGLSLLQLSTAAGSMAEIAAVAFSSFLFAACGLRIVVNAIAAVAAAVTATMVVVGAGRWLHLPLTPWHHSTTAACLRE